MYLRYDPSKPHVFHVIAVTILEVLFLIVRPRCTLGAPEQRSDPRIRTPILHCLRTQRRTASLKILIRQTVCEVLVYEGPYVFASNTLL